MVERQPEKMHTKKKEKNGFIDAVSNSSNRGSRSNQDLEHDPKYQENYPREYLPSKSAKANWEKTQRYLNVPDWPAKHNLTVYSL